MSYLSEESLINDNINDDEKKLIEEDVKNILRNELSSKDYENLTLDDKLKKLFTFDDNVNTIRFNYLMNGISYVSNIININDVINL